MDDDLPSEFDLIVVGTGFSESIIAAAASRIGKSVLHIDPNDFYCATWASFNLDSFQNFMNKCTEKINNSADENNLKIIENCCNVKNTNQKWFIDENDEEEKTAIQNDQNSEYDNNSTTNQDINLSNEKQEKWTKSKIMKEFRKFNIDLVPKLLYCGGNLVELLISSNICRYAEFRAIDKVCTILDETITNVPCSRSDVFKSSDLSVIEKRLLMKLLTDCFKYEEKDDTNYTKNDGKCENIESAAEVENKEEIKEINNELEKYKNKTFYEYLKDKKLPDKILHCVLYSISISNKNTPFKTSINNVKKFLKSLNRYGNAPFLFPMYGCGEIPQDFCRLCAVFGGVYSLKIPINDIKIEDEIIECNVNSKGDADKSIKKKVTMVICNEKNIKVKNLVIGGNNIPNGLIKLNENRVNSNKEYCGELSRGVFITSMPLGNKELNSGGGGVNFLRLPPINENNDDGAIVIQLSHYSQTCPKGLYLIHITSQSKSDSPELDLNPYVSQIFNNNDKNLELSSIKNKPNILYSAYFKIAKCKNCSFSIESNLFSNIYLTCGPFYEIDYDKSIQNARKIFEKLYPNEEFLPRAPDPEEIIIGDEDPTEITRAEEIKEDYGQK